MCGRFVLTTTCEQFRKTLGVSDPPAMPPRCNIAPTQEVLVIHQQPLVM